MFQYDKRILSESIFLKDLELSGCFLNRDKDLPWFILIPKVDEITELIDLNKEQQHKLFEEINFLSQILKKELKVDKINIGMIGNVVSQFHVHIVGRYKNDRLFPNVVWGSRIDEREEILKIKFSSLFEIIHG